MSVHRNAKLGLAGRFALVSAVEGGASLRSAAAAFNVSPATAHRWWHRWLAAGEEARSTLSCLFDRSSRPHRSPRQLAPELAEAICDCRRKTGWGPRLVAGATGFAHSTISKVLKRAGISRPPRPQREPANSDEWPCPGDLLHMDTSEYVRFQKPGHRVTGDRSSQHRQHRDGIDFAHAIVDDHSRLAYAVCATSERGRRRESNPRNVAFGAWRDSHAVICSPEGPLSSSPDPQRGAFPGFSKPSTRKRRRAGTSSSSSRVPI